MLNWMKSTCHLTRIGHGIEYFDPGYIKQADVLQGIYFFEEEFEIEEIDKHFRFYEPLTVHESSLSPCVHAILACRIGHFDKAYEMYLRTARLDLDDYNNDTEDGLILPAWPEHGCL